MPLQPILIISLLICGCTKRIATPYHIVEQFPTEQRLEGEPIPQLDDCLGIIDIGTAGSFLICKEHKTTYHFAIYDSVFRKIGHWGRRGRGAGEYLAPIYYGQCEMAAGLVRIFLWERILQELYTVDIIDTTDSTGLKLSSKFSIPRGSKLEPRILVRKDENTFFGVSDWMDCRFFSCDSTFRNPAIASPVFAFDNPIAHEICQSCYGVKPDKTRIAIAYFNMPQIDIRTSDGTIVRTVFWDRIRPPQELDPDNLATYCYKADADDRFVYVLCDDPDSETSGRNSILVFDWDGTPVAKYSILRASSFAVDKQRRRIITVNMNQTNSLYSIPTIIRCGSDAKQLLPEPQNS